TAVPVGSFTFTYSGDAPDGTTIRIGVGVGRRSGEPVEVFDFTMDISGNDKNEASARLETQLVDRGLDVQRVSPNSLDVLGASSFVISEIAGGSTQPRFPVRLDGTDIDITRNLKPGSKWKVGVGLFQPCQAVAGGSETVSLQDNLPKSVLVLST